LIKQLMYKWFGLSDPPCETCEVLREQLANSERERRDILTKLLEKDKPEPPQIVDKEELTPIQPQFVPWRVRQQMLEAEDRRAAALLKDRRKEIDKLEVELGVAPDVERGPSGGVTAEVK